MTLILKCAWRASLGLGGWRLPLRGLTFRFRITSVNPCLVTCGDAFREVLIRFSAL